MYKMYKMAKDVVIAEEVDDADLTVKLVKDFDSKEYVLVKRKGKIEIYNFSLLGQVTEITDDISFEEFRKITYAKFSKESLEQKFNSNKKDYPRFDWRFFAERRHN